MVGQRNKLDEKIDGWLNGQKTFRKNRWMVGWTGKKQKDSWRDIKIDGWMDRNNRWMVGWTGKNRRMVGCTIQSVICLIHIVH